MRLVSLGGVLRLSRLFVRTLREDPADAEVPSHRLLVRAGYVRRVGPGIYSWLPLGIEVLRNIERVVREEMVGIGGQEVLFPALIPREIFEASGRWADYGDALFRLADRKGAEYLLGPTHEELFTLLVKGEYSSYRDYPLILFQIQTKYRDEARPRGGVLRGREFVMKDSYSFDVSDEGLAAAYRAHRDAYERIFTRLGFEYRIVFAVSGAMGGSASEEFLAPTPVGEDTFVQCEGCDYAANTEAVEIAGPPAQDPSRAPAERGAGHAGHADHRVPRHADESARPSDHGGGHAEERCPQDATARLADVGAARGRCAGRPRRRPETPRRAARSGRGRCRRRGRPRGPAGAGEGVYRPADPRRPRRGALPGRSAGRAGHGLGHRRERAGPARRERCPWSGLHPGR